MRAAFLSVTLVAAVLGGSASAPPDDITGEVRDNDGPVAGAHVRIQGACTFTSTDKHGRFRLGAAEKAAGRVTAWKTGYAIAATAPGKPLLRLSLVPLPAKDNPDYTWIDPAPDPKTKHNCGNCHRAIHDEWASSGHARAADNRRLKNLFEGTDWHGKRSPTWSLKDEHPLGMSVCASCHAPTYQDPGLAYDLSQVRGVAARGVHCDYCHKIVDAPTDKLGTRFGRDGLGLLRPAQGELLVFGPLDDAVRPGEIFGYSPLYKESRYCASCHEGVLFGVHVYSTYSEWLESPQRRQGVHCQDCHMKPTGKMTNIAPGHGGIERDPRTLASHALPGAQPDLLRGCLSVKIDSRRDADRVLLSLEILAENVGHRVPTGFIDRHLLLVVEAFDSKGRPLSARKGPTLPPAAGRELTGMAGVVFGRMLKSSDGRAVPFWQAHEKSADTRLHPGKAEHAQFAFAADCREVRVRVLYRRFWHDVARAKGWPENEIVVIDRKVPVK